MGTWVINLHLTEINLMGKHSTVVLDVSRRCGMNLCEKFRYSWDTGYQWIKLKGVLYMVAKVKKEGYNTMLVDKASRQALEDGLMEEFVSQFFCKVKVPQYNSCDYILL